MHHEMSVLIDRILARIRVTAIIPDSLASDVQRLAGRKNLSESIVHALWEWVDLQRIRGSARTLNRSPLR